MGTGEYGDGAMGMGDTLGMGTWGHVGGGDVGTGTWGRDTGTRWGLGVGVGRYGDPVGTCWGQELQKAMALFWGRTLCGPIGEMCGAVAASCSRQHQEGRGGGVGRALSFLCSPCAGGGGGVGSGVWGSPIEDIPHCSGVRAAGRPCVPWSCSVGWGCTHGVGLWGSCTHCMGFCTHCMGFLGFLQP